MNDDTIENNENVTECKSNKEILNGIEFDTKKTMEDYKYVVLAYK